MASYWSSKYSIVNLAVVGFLALLVSDIVGILIYGYSTGWHNITEDFQTQAVLKVTVIVQVCVYTCSYFLGSRYNKVKNESANEVGTDAQKDARPF